MKEVVLTKIEAHNFKGLEKFSQEFSKKTHISGGNAKLKSTIYQAYLWCIFGKDAKGEVANVQPRDDSKEIVHNLVTSVELNFKVDNSLVVIKRELSEKWVIPRGQEEALLQGTETTYYYNDVPCKKSEYEAKLNEICPLDTWMMMSNINSFFKLNVQLRRQTLQSLAGDISDIEIAEDYPNVKEALLNNKSVDEFKKEIQAKKKKSKSNFEEIPSRLDQQEKLRVNFDFASIRSNIKEREVKIEEIDSSLQKRASNSSFSLQNEKRTLYSKKRNEMLILENKLKVDFLSVKTNLEQDINSHNSAIEMAEKAIKEYQALLLSFEEKKEKLYEKSAFLKEKWVSKNQEVPTDDNICSECGQEYPQEKIAQKIELFNKSKLEKLGAIVKEAEENQTNINSIISDINKYTLAINDKESVIKDRKIVIEELQKLLTEGISIETLISESNIPTLKAECKTLFDEIEALNPNETISDAELREQKSTLQEQVRVLQAQAAQENTNANIDKLKQELIEEKKTLAQVISNLDKIEFEIITFQKRRIEIIEEKVSSLFSIVKWKMYESNLTNDGEKAICEAYVNGIPYDETNEGMTMAIGVDVIQGLSSAYDISVPLFVDRFESVEILPKVNSQLITLEVVKGAELSINF